MKHRPLFGCHNHSINIRPHIYQLSGGRLLKWFDWTWGKDELEGQMWLLGSPQKRGSHLSGEKVSVFYLFPSLPQGNEHITKNNTVAQFCRLHRRLYNDSQQVYNSWSRMHSAPVALLKLQYSLLQGHWEQERVKYTAGHFNTCMWAVRASYSSHLLLHALLLPWSHSHNHLYLV